MIKPNQPRSDSEQAWRKQKKKYYIARNKDGSIKSIKSQSFNSNNIKNKNPKLERRSGPQKKSFLRRFFLSKKFIFFIFSCFLLVFIFGSLSFLWVTRGLPEPGELMKRELAQSTKIFDRTGEKVLYEVHGNVNRTIIKLEEIPDHVKNATIAIEDKNFYQHKGFSSWAIFRSLVKYAVFGQKAGGSTLTQQFLKNAFFGAGNTFSEKLARKLKEWRLAYRMEKQMSKEQILELYLNEIPYGSTAYGVEAASQLYFGKTVREISLAESAVLAAIVQAPSRYSPYGPNRELLLGRQKYILSLMVEQNYITKEKAEEAKAEEITFRPPQHVMLAPHFVMYVKEILARQHGFAESSIERGGYKIYTTLDLYKQEIAEEIIKEKAEINAKTHNASNAALVSIDPKNGQVLAMVGSKNFYSQEIDGQVNVTISQRQPGSSIKPLVYAAAFTKGYTPNTILYDVLTNFSNTDKSYEPRNYNLNESGPVSMKQALAGSLNIPAVKAIYLAGLDNVLDLAKKMGYNTLNDRDRFGLSLVLGGGEVKLLEHTNAFSAFARDGIVKDNEVILRIEDKDGNIIYEHKEQEGRKVFEPEIARMINNILIDNNARAFTFGLNNPLNMGKRPVGAKTGTTNDYRDAWAIGYTPSIVTGVWAGNNDNSPMNRGAGGSKVAAPIWNEYMKRILGDTPIENFHDWSHKKTGKAILDGDMESGVVVKIDKASGLLATEYTPESFIEERMYRQDHSILYYVDKNNPLGKIPSNPAVDPQFELWESRIQAWAEKEMAESDSDSITEGPPPKEYDNLHIPENRPIFKVTDFTNTQNVIIPVLSLNLEASAPRGINRAEYYINNNLIAKNFSYPFNLTEDISFLKNGYHNLRVRVCDDIDNCSEQSFEFNLILDNEARVNGQNDVLSIAWSYPSSGLAINSIDFPLIMKIKNSSPKQIVKINIYSKSAEHEPFVILGSIEPVNTDPAEFTWSKSPRTGTYKMYAEANTWSGEKIKSSEIIITVNNIETDELSTEGEEE